MRRNMPTTGQMPPTELSNADTPATTIITATATQPRPLIAMPISKPTVPPRVPAVAARPHPRQVGTDPVGQRSERRAQPGDHAGGQVPGGQADGHRRGDRQ